MGKTVAAIVGVVAVIAIAIAAPYLAPLALGVLGITATTTAVAIATAVIGLTLSVGLSLAFRALGVGAPTAKNAVGPPQVFRQSIANSFIVYGKRRVGGLLVFFHGRRAGDDHYRYFVIAVAGHRCKGLVSWMLSDETVTVDGSNKVTSGKYNNAAWLWFVRGTDSDVANATFVSECGGKWTANHKGLGVAKIYAKFKMTDDVVQAGMPNITAIIEGKDDILDPRDASVDYTRNAPLTFYDWMKIPREEGGFGAYDDEIPDDTWISAQANVADETVNGQPRYAIDAVITTGAAPNEIRDVLIVNQAGSYTYSGGKHLMRPGYWVPVSATLSEDDLAGPIQVSPFMASDAAANEVQGSYIDPNSGYQGAPFTTQTTDPAPTDIRQLDVDLAFTTNKDQADRIAKIMLRRAQAEKTLVWPMNIAGLKNKALDTVQVESERYGLNNYAWAVTNWSLSADWGVVLSLREENEDIYAEPDVVTPVTPPAIDPGEPVSTLTETQTVLRSTYARAITATGFDDGTTARIDLTGASAVLDYGGTIGAVALTNLPASLTGLAFTTKYYLFVDVDAVGDATPTYGATTNKAEAINSSVHPYRVFLNQEVTTPADGGSSSAGGGSGGGYGGGGEVLSSL
jgi:hypothetical protein